MTDIVDIEQPFRSYSFRNGSRRDIDPTELDPTQYLFLQNGRVRNGVIEPVNVPLDLSAGLPTGNRQGVYVVGNTLFAFVDGRAFIKNLLSTDGFFAIEHFQLNSTVDRIYIALVPSSTINFTRQADSANLPTGNTLGTSITFTSSIEPSPVCILCQDGKSRPLLIISPTNVRVAQDIDAWQIDNREYVPIGKQMLYLTNCAKLLILSPDGREIYDSVSGRPLDFVKAVDEDGDRLRSSLPDNGIEASRLSWSVDYDEITSITTVTANGELNELIEGNQKDFYIATTRYKTFMVMLDYLNPIYGEPRFRNKFLFPVGAVNDECFCDLLGDTAIIDDAGLKSFNSIFTLEADGVNSEFSKSFKLYFEGINQDIACCATFDDYAFFAIKTIFGYKIAVFDMLSKVFVALDDWELPAPVFQFAFGKFNNERHLYFMTTDAKVYEAFAGTGVLNRILMTKEWTGDSTMLSIKPVFAKVAFQNCKSGGTVFATHYTDRMKSKVLSEKIEAKVDDNASSDIPYGDTREDSIETLDYALIEGRSGVKISLKVECRVDADILFVEQYATGIVTKSSLEQQQKTYA